MFYWKVSLEESSLNLLSFLKSRLGSSFSVRKIKRLLEGSRCELNGKVERFSTRKVGLGDEISLNVASFPPLDLVEGSPILFEDDYILAYNKNAGISSQGNESLEKILSVSYPSHLKLAHRLDKDTTGVILFAKDAFSERVLKEQFLVRSVNKVYLALVDGEVLGSSGKMQSYLAKRCSYQGQSIWGETERKKGKFSLTFWEKKACSNGATLLRCFPKTGRTHQIRVHLKEMGYPILGDFHYARSFSCKRHKPFRYLLHSEEIRLKHPVFSKEISIKAPIPKDFLQAFQDLGISEFSI